MTNPSYPWVNGDLVTDQALLAAFRLHGRPAREAGVVPGTEADQGPGLRTLMQVVRQAGGGVIDLEPGIYTTSRLDPIPGVKLRAQSLGSTVLRAVAGGNGVVYGQDPAAFAAMVGTDDFQGAAPHDFGLQNIVLDGNAAQQDIAAGARDLASPFQVYGYHYFLDGLRILNPVGHAGRSEWGRYGDFAMQAYVRRVETDAAPRHGWWWNGPHDSLLSEILPVDSSAETDNTWCGIFVGPNGGSRWHRVHPWHRSTATRRMRCSVASSGGNLFTDGDYEGGRTLFEAGPEDTVGGHFYAGFGTAGGCMLDCKANLVTLAAGTSFKNTTNADIFAIRLGNAGAPISGLVTGNLIIGGFSTRGAIDAAGDGGGSRIVATGWGNGAAVPATMHAQSIYDLDFNTPTLRVLRQQLRPGAYANAAAAKAALPWLRYGDEFLASDGTVRWVNV